MEHRMRRRRPVVLIAAVLGLAALGVISGPVAPVAAGGFTSTSLAATAPISGLGARWSMTMDLRGGESVVVVQRRNAAGTATASLRTRSNDASLTCTAKLASCVVSDDGSLGVYGRIDLGFSATAPRTSKERRCPGTDIIRAIEYRRKGALTGTFRLASKTDLIGVVRNGAGAHRVPASIPATITRVVTTGAACPDAEGLQCPEQVGLLADSLSAERKLASGGTSVTWRMSVASDAPSVVRSQIILVRSSAGALAVNSPTTLGSAVLDIDRGAPFLTGGGLYASSAPKEPALVLSCATAERRDGAMLRSLTIKFPWYSLPEVDDEVLASVVHVID